MECLGGIVAQGRQGFKRIFRSDALQNLLVRKNLVAAPAVARKGHKLNESHMNRYVPRPSHKIQNFVVVHVLYDHHIDFYVEMIGQQQLNALAHKREAVAAGHLEKSFGPQGIEAHIDRSDRRIQEAGQ
jgi:hypothetical protein